MQWEEALLFPRSGLWLINSSASNNRTCINDTVTINNHESTSISVLEEVNRSIKGQTPGSKDFDGNRDSNDHTILVVPESTITLQLTILAETIIGKTITINN